MSDESSLDDVQGVQEHLMTALSQGGTPFGILPLFTLDEPDRSRKHILSYEQEVSLNEEQLTFKWQVSANPSFGFPDVFDRKIFKIIESLALQQQKTLKNPVQFPLHEILQVLNLPSLGVHFARVRSSIQRIASLKVHTHFTRSSGDKADLYSDTFHIYDDVTFQDGSFGNDIGAGNHQLTFGDWYLGSLNFGQIKPVDLQYFNGIVNPEASRLYEVLLVKFDEATTDHQKGWQLTYSDLCHLMPLKEAGWMSSPQRQLEEMHEELIKTGFLDRVEWEKTGDSWRLLYIPGGRAREGTAPEDDDD